MEYTNKSAGGSYQLLTGNTIHDQMRGGNCQLLDAQDCLSIGWNNTLGVTNKHAGGNCQFKLLAYIHGQTRSPGPRRGGNGQLLRDKWGELA
jgi:hypothetical protein